jgi:hypothetical protein
MTKRSDRGGPNPLCTKGNQARGSDGVLTHGYSSWACSERCEPSPDTWLQPRPNARDSDCLTTGSRPYMLQIEFGRSEHPRSCIGYTGRAPCVATRQTPSSYLHQSPCDRALPPITRACSGVIVKPNSAVIDVQRHIDSGRATRIAYRRIAGRPHHSRGPCFWGNARASFQTRVSAPKGRRARVVVTTCQLTWSAKLLCSACVVS